MIKGRPRRLEVVLVSQPLYFVTFSTRDRRPIPSMNKTHEALRSFGHRAQQEHNAGVGRYVIMPDHIHLFVRGDDNFVLSRWIGGLKRGISIELQATDLWQPGFFDHVLRSDESYGEKWNYVRENPVRAGLVGRADDWPYQGEITLITSA